jgi:hypothetical protein
MKLPTNKKWWQFWLPKYIHVSEEAAKSAVWPSHVDSLNNSSVLKERGRVVTVKSAPEYTPDTTRKSGRMVRIMPRQLKKLKDGQERGNV